MPSFVPLPPSYQRRKNVHLFQKDFLPLSDGFSIRYSSLMCAKRSLRQPARKTTDLTVPVSSLAPGNTIRSGYHSWRPSPRGSGRSPVRNDAGRNALNGVKVSSPVKQNVPEWPSVYIVSDAVMASAAKAISIGSPIGAPGVQVHGMYRRLFQELGRSPWMISPKRSNCPQGVMSKWSVVSRREVRWFRSSGEVG